MFKKVVNILLYQMLEYKNEGQKGRGLICLYNSYSKFTLPSSR